MAEGSRWEDEREVLAAVYAAAAVGRAIRTRSQDDHTAARPDRQGLRDGASSRRATLLCLAATAGPAAAAPVVGIGDQEPGTFVDPWFSWSGVGTARLIVSWDVALTDPGSVGPWLETARRMHVQPLVAFQHRRGEGRPAYLPSRGEYRAAVAAFQARWPWVRLYTPWNEENHPDQPTADNPAAAAGFYEVVRDLCPGSAWSRPTSSRGDDLVPWLAPFQAALGAPALLLEPAPTSGPAPPAAFRW